MTAAAAVLQVRNLVVDRASGHRRFRLEIPQLRLAAREAVAVVGPSGSGKSTMLDALATILRPTWVDSFLLRTVTGETVDLAQPLRLGADRRLDRLRAANIGYVLQAGGLLPFISAEANVRLTARLAGLPPRLARDRARDLAARLGVAGLLKDKPGRLSVGERQRIAVARALCHRPCLILADEPTAALDGAAARNVLGLLVELAAGTGACLIIASHDTGLLDRFGLPRAEYRQTELGGEQVQASFSYRGCQ